MLFLQSPKIKLEQYSHPTSLATEIKIKVVELCVDSYFMA